jgi:hypothetical protein
MFKLIVSSVQKVNKNNNTKLQKTFKIINFNNFIVIAITEKNGSGRKGIFEEYSAKLIKDRA